MAGGLDAGTYTVDAAPGEHAVVVPGTAAGQVGEMRCLVAPLGDRPAIRFHEVVEIGPGHAWCSATTRPAIRRSP